MGVEVARALEQRLADLKACQNIAEFEELFGTQPVELEPLARMIDLPCGYRLVFVSGHVKTPSDRAHKIIWAHVTKIKITALEAIDAGH